MLLENKTNKQTNNTFLHTAYGEVVAKSHVTIHYNKHERENE